MTDLFKLTSLARKRLNLMEEPAGLVQIVLGDATIERRPGGDLKILWKNQLVVHVVDHLVEEFHPEHLRPVTETLATR